MRDEKKTRAQLIEELKELRKNLLELKASPSSGRLKALIDDKEQIMRLITENLSDLVAILDKNGKRLYNSASYKNILGSPDKLKGTDSFREIHPEDRDKIKKLFKKTIKEGKGERAEYRFISEIGNIHYIESQGDVIKNDRGEVENVIVIGRDVTERKKIEKALFDSEERLKSILKSIPDIIYRLDPEGKITFISSAIQKYGYDANALLGKSILDIVHPDDIEKAKYRINERRTGDRKTKSLELRFVTSKGKSVYFEDRSKSIKMEPVFLLEAEGLYSTSYPKAKSFLGTQGIARDITERKRTEEEASMLAQALRSISECVSVTDLNRNIIFINDAFLKTYGYERHQLIDKPVSIIESKQQYAGETTENVSTPLSGDWKSEVIHKRKDGSEFPVQLSTSVINDQNGYPMALITVTTDISERKHLETQLQQSQKLEAIGKLAGGIAHDFNNLLTVIQGYSELLLNKINVNDPIAAQVSQISEAASRAESLIRQLLAFSRKQVMQPRVIDLNHLIEEMREMLQRLIGADIEFVINLDSKLGKIRADAGQIEQVMMNLAVNARDAMTNGGKLTIETMNTYLDEKFQSNYPEASIGNYIKLTISDTGYGMDEATQIRIFEPFFTTKQKGEGTGLGLATVYGIIKQSDGYIYVKSALKKGTTFSLYFPRVDAPLDYEEKVKIKDQNISGTETILVVEDQDEVRKLIVDTLKLYGYNVLEAPHGGSALLICEQYQGKIELIISDIVMPQMSGQELVERLLPLQPEMKILYISGYSEDVFSNKNYLDPGILFVQKPFTPAELLSKVRKVLDSI